MIQRLARATALTLPILWLSGCVSATDTGPTSTQRMQADVGKPLSEPIIRNGPPESIVRISNSQVAATFLKSGDTISGGGVYTIPGSRTMSPIVTGAPIRSEHYECRYTLIVDAPRDRMPPSEMIVRDFRPVSPGCD